MVHQHVYAALFPLLALVHVVLAADTLEEEFSHRDLVLLQHFRDAWDDHSSIVGSFDSSLERDFLQLKAALEPTLASLPLSTDQRFESTAVRYALHRLLMRRHGWSIAGLDPKGQAWNSTWTGSVTLLAKAPKEVREVVKVHVNAGLTANGVALMSVLLQHLVREEAAQGLRGVLRALQLPMDGPWDPFTAERVLDAHVASVLLSRSPNSLSPKTWLAEIRGVAEWYPNWPALQKLVHRELRRELEGHRPDLAVLTKVAGTVGESWGVWANGECRAMKSELSAMEEYGNGRVRLSDFYGKAAHEGKWQLTESVEYLRQLGALDESNPRNPRIIIPNYITSSNNCLAASNTMSVCCISECENIMHELEAKVRAPEILPQRLLEVIEALPSTIPGPASKGFSPVMLNRINSIAMENGGMVPLHGRLFAQWLHHVYPRECPYPYLAGKTHQRDMEAFTEQTGLNFTASAEVIEALAGKAQSWKEPRMQENTPWSHQEELFVPLGQRPVAWAMLHGSVFVAALAVGTLGYSLMHMARSARRTAALKLQTAPSKLYPV